LIIVADHSINNALKALGGEIVKRWCVYESIPLVGGRGTPRSSDGSAEASRAPPGCAFSDPL
jgi:hypothetical protein